ncbi:hypothetical protein D3C76_1698560 [compost metagenome]
MKKVIEKDILDPKNKLKSDDRLDVKSKIKNTSDKQVSVSKTKIKSEVSKEDKTR